MTEGSGPSGTVTCSACGSSQASEATFCTNCGALLTSGAEPPSLPPVPPVAAQPEPPAPLYPVTFTFEGPEQLSKLSTLFRLVLIIPVVLFLAVLSGGGGSYTRPGGAGEALAIGGGAFGGLVGAYLISAFARGGRPVGWLGSVLVAIQRFQLRAYTYILLLTDKYPAFEGEWYAQFEAERPERISRRQMVIWKTLTAIPHFVVLAALGFAVAVCEVIAWFAILFTGRFPQGMRDFVVGWLRWQARVTAYVISLRDEFPPYSLSHTAGPGTKQAKLWSGIGGIAIVLALGGVAAAAFIALTSSESAHVSYARLTQGRATESIEIENVQLTLRIVDDNYDFPDNLLIPDDDSRLVFLEASISNGGVRGLDIDLDDFELRDYFGDKERPQFVSVGGVAPPAVLEVDELTLVVIVFEVEGRDYPTEFRYDPSGGFKNAKFIFDP